VLNRPACITTTPHKRKAPGELREALETRRRAVLNQLDEKLAEILAPWLAHKIVDDFELVLREADHDVRRELERVTTPQT
jgi:hypothetical protein